MDQSQNIATYEDINCRITRTLLLYVKEENGGSLGSLLDGLPLDEEYLMDTANWVSHSFLQELYRRMIDILGDENAVYNMALASGRLRSLGILDRIVKLLGSPKLIYSQAPKYNKFLKLNVSVYIHEIDDTSVLLEDRYHDCAQKTRYDCDYTRAILAGIPTMFDLPLADVEEIKCQVSLEKYGDRIWPDNPPQGSGGCFYRVTWSNKRTAFLHRFLFGWRNRRSAIEDLVQANQKIQLKYEEAKQLAAKLENANIALREAKRNLETQKAELIESERRYRLLAENVSDIIWVLDLQNLKFKYCSPSVQRIRGFTPEEAMSLSLDQTLSPDSLTKVTQILQEELANDHKPGVDPQRSRTVEIKHAIKDVGWAWAEATVSFIHDSEGKPTAILGVTRDISIRKEGQRILAESERKYRNLFENGSDLLCIHDLEGNLLETNMQFKDEYGWKEEELEGVNIRTLIPEQYRDEFDDYLKRIISKGSDEGYLQLRTRTGGVALLEYRNKLMVDDSGMPQAVQGSARDVTALKAAEQQKRNLQEELQHSKKMEALGTLAGGIAHDFNNLLSAIMGYGELARLKLDQGKIPSKDLDAILKATERARDLVKHLLAFSRKSEPDLKPLDLNSLITKSLKLLERTIPKMVAIRMKLSDEKAQIRGDSTQLEQVIMNLASNAADAMPDGGEMVFETKIAIGEAGPEEHNLENKHEGYVLLTASDNGIGMSGEVLEQIFNPFFTTKELGKGTGLGLSTVYGTIHDHGGKVYCSSKTGEGTTFSIYLPLIKESESTSDANGQEAWEAPGGDETILLVEDEKAIRDMGMEIFKASGYQVIGAATGEEALATYRENFQDINLVVLDLGMPGMGGHKCLKELIAINPEIKVLVASGYSANGGVKDVIGEGASGYIAKPYKMFDLLQTVRQVLDFKPEMSLVN